MRVFFEEYHEFGRCLRCSTGKAEAVFSLGFGPRILRFGLSGRPNVFFEQPPGSPYLRTPEGWRIYGGTRLWFAPESAKSYYPDNQSLRFSVSERKVVLAQPLDPWTGLRKTIRAGFVGPETLDVEYEIENASGDAVAGSPWAITSVRPGGVLVASWPESRGKPNPDRFISLWGETSLSDRRLRFGPGQVEIRPLEDRAYFKLGLGASITEAEYRLPEQTFVKKFSANGPFADNNSNLEVFCSDRMLEFETLGRLRRLENGEKAVHREEWTLKETEAGK